jgi:phosphoribosylanthranilate isomerase
MNHRTRIKLCGLKRPIDVQAAAAAGADAIGLVFYPPSPRYVSATEAAKLLECLPPFISSVGLFVNAEVELVREIVAAAPISMLQFHGDESPDQCVRIAEAVGRPFLRALRIRSETQPADLLESAHRYRGASPLFAGLLLDTWSDAYGGTGKAFNWSLVPAEIARLAVLSGGLNVQNVTDAVRRIRPHAVDVSSGIEASQGVKDPALMQAFVNAVRVGDADSDRR